jgi:hypothetical protein
VPSPYGFSLNGIGIELLLDLLTRRSASTILYPSGGVAPLQNPCLAGSRIARVVLFEISREVCSSKAPMIPDQLGSSPVGWVTETTSTPCFAQLADGQLHLGHVTEEPINAWKTIASYG